MNAFDKNFGSNNPRRKPNTVNLQDLPVHTMDKEKAMREVMDNKAIKELYVEDPMVVLVALAGMAIFRELVEDKGYPEKMASDLSNILVFGLRVDPKSLPNWADFKARHKIIAS